MAWAVLSGYSGKPSKQPVDVERSLSKKQLAHKYGKFTVLGKSATGRVELGLGVKERKKTANSDLLISSDQEAGTLFTSTDGGKDWTPVTSAKNTSSAVWAPKGEVFAAMYGIGKTHSGNTGTGGTSYGAPAEVGLFEVEQDGDVTQLASTPSGLTRLGKFPLPHSRQKFTDYYWAQSRNW